jgi:hypothetical protein
VKPRSIRWLKFPKLKHLLNKKQWLNNLSPKRLLQRAPLWKLQWILKFSKNRLKMSQSRKKSNSRCKTTLEVIR